MFFYVFIDKLVLRVVYTFLYFLLKSGRLFKIKASLNYRTYKLLGKGSLLYFTSKSFFKNGVIFILAYLYYFRRLLMHSLFFFSNNNNFTNKKYANLNFFYYGFFLIFKFFFLSTLILFTILYVLSVYHVTPFFKLLFS